MFLGDSYRTMVSREKLIRALKDSADLEDEGIILITTVLKKRVEKSSLPEGKRQRLMEIADTIKKESEEHRKAIIETVEKIGGRERDGF